MLENEDLETLKQLDKNIGQLAYYSYNYCLHKFRLLKEDEEYNEFKFLETLIKFSDLPDKIQKLWIALEFIIQLTNKDSHFNENVSLGEIGFNIFCEHIVKIYPDQICLPFDEIPHLMQDVWDLTVYMVCDDNQKLIL